jgi:hypothetical protein
MTRNSRSLSLFQQNEYSSNTKAFTVTASGGGGGDARPFTAAGGTSVTLVPNVINMAVGDTHMIQAVNGSGQSVAGLTWTSTNQSVVSLSTDDPPILNALTAGHVTVYRRAVKRSRPIIITGGSFIWDFGISFASEPNVPNP